VTPSQSQQSERPKPGSTLANEGGETAYWLAADYSVEDITDEWDHLFDEIPVERRLGQCWLRPRWTTAEERADEDRLYDLFGDFEDSGCDTSVAYEMAKPNAEGGHLYWTTEYPPTEVDAKTGKETR
jgi:hypothetical protein